jgi:hypothetical protein
MALKGKRKSQSRGSQGRRRPAGAPRPVVSPRGPRRWYRSPAGRAVAAIIAVALLGGVVAAVVGARSGAAELEQRQDALRSFTGEVRVALQSIRVATGDMSEAPVTASDPRALEGLRASAEGWARTLQEAQGNLVGLTPAPGANSAQRLFVQSTQLYAGAAKTYALVPRIEGDLRDGLLTRAAEQRDLAAGIWEEATRLLDLERNEADLGPSALSSPSVPAAAAPPTTPGGGQDGGGGGQGSGGQDGQGQGGPGDGN